MFNSQFLIPFKKEEDLTAIDWILKTEKHNLECFNKARESLKLEYLFTNYPNSFLDETFSIEIQDNEDRLSRVTSNSPENNTNWGSSNLVFSPIGQEKLWYTKALQEQKKGRSTVLVFAIPIKYRFEQIPSVLEIPLHTKNLEYLWTGIKVINCHNLFNQVFINHDYYTLYYTKLNALSNDNKESTLNIKHLTLV